MRIANKISLSFFVTAVVLTTTSASVFYFNVKSRLEDEILSKLEAVLQSRANHIETYLGMLKVSAGELSKSVILQNFLRIANDNGSGYEEAFRTAESRLVKTKEINPSIYEFLLIDAAGKVIASTDTSSIGSDKSADAIFLGGQNSFYIKDVYYSPITKTSLIAVSAPVLGLRDDDFLGVIAARVKIDELNRIVANTAGLGDTGDLYIVNKYGFMITNSRFPTRGVLKQKVDTKGVRQGRLHKDKTHILPEHKRADIYSDYRGVMVLGAHEYIPEMRWTVIAEIDVREAFSPLILITVLYLVIMLLVPALAWLAGIAIASAVTRPLENLHKGMEVVGSGNFDYRVGTDAKDEVGQLSRAFDEMTVELKKTTTSVGKLTREIDERKKAEEALRDSEQWFSTTLSSIGDAVIATDIKGNITFINPAAEQLTGCSRAQAVGDYIDGVFNIRKEGTGEKADNPVLRALGENRIVKLANHTVLISKKGAVYSIDDSAAPIKDPTSGEIIGAVLVFRDITERNRRERELRELSLAVEQSPACVVITDTDGNIQYVNRKFTQLTGYSSEEAVGKNPRILKTDSQPPEFYKNLWDTVTSGKEWRGEFHNKKKSGELYWESASISPLKNSDGKITNYIGVKEDITERKKMEAELRDATAVKSKFTSMVSHELRSPLAVIKESVNIILDGLVGQINAEQKDLLETAKNNSDRLSRLINNVLDFQKMDAGKMDYEFKENDINEVVETAVKSAGLLTKEKGLELTFKPGEGIPALFFDKDKITQVVTNLLSNAVKFTEKGGIYVSTKKNDNTVEVIVRDTGPGIKSEDMSKLFQTFEQLEGQKGKKRTGTGLGLAISKEIILAHKGKTWAESEPGNGTTFHFILPIKERRK